MDDKDHDSDDFLLVERDSLRVRRPSPPVPLHDTPPPSLAQSKTFAVPKSLPFTPPSCPPVDRRLTRSIPQSTLGSSSARREEASDNQGPNPLSYSLPLVFTPPVPKAHSSGTRSRSGTLPFSRIPSSPSPLPREAVGEKRNSVSSFPPLLGGSSTNRYQFGGTGNQDLDFSSLVPEKSEDFTATLGASVLSYSADPTDEDSDNDDVLAPNGDKWQGAHYLPVSLRASQLPLLQAQANQYHSDTSDADAEDLQGSSDQRPWLRIIFAGAEGPASDRMAILNQFRRVWTQAIKGNSRRKTTALSSELEAKTESILGERATHFDRTDPQVLYEHLFAVPLPDHSGMSSVADQIPLATAPQPLAKVTLGCPPTPVVSSLVWTQPPRDDQTEQEMPSFFDSPMAQRLMGYFREQLVAYQLLTSEDTVVSPDEISWGILPVFTMVVYFLRDDDLDRYVLDLKSLVPFVPVLPLLYTEAANMVEAKQAVHEALAFNNLLDSLVQLPTVLDANLSGDDSKHIPSLLTCITPAELVQSDPAVVYRAMMNHTRVELVTDLSSRSSRSVVTTRGLSSVVTSGRMTPHPFAVTGLVGNRSSTPCDNFRWQQVKRSMGWIAKKLLWGILFLCLLNALIPKDDDGAERAVFDMPKWLGGLSFTQSSLSWVECATPSADDKISCMYDLNLRDNQGVPWLLPVAEYDDRFGAIQCHHLDAFIALQIGHVQRFSKPLPEEYPITQSEEQPLTVKRRWYQSSRLENEVGKDGITPGAATVCILRLEITFPVSLTTTSGQGDLSLLSVWFRGSSSQVAHSPLVLNPVDRTLGQSGAQAVPDDIYDHLETVKATDKGTQRKIHPGIGSHSLSKTASVIEMTELPPITASLGTARSEGLYKEKLTHRQTEKGMPATGDNQDQEKSKANDESSSAIAAESVQGNWSTFSEEAMERVTVWVNHTKAMVTLWLATAGKWWEAVQLTPVWLHSAGDHVRQWYRTMAAQLSPYVRKVVYRTREVTQIMEQGTRHFLERRRTTFIRKTNRFKANFYRVQHDTGKLWKSSCQWASRMWQNLRKKSQ
ncbi:hypothetical protein IWQ62_002187 [Dispira parvispora]|uniref:Uncharacterized protein n=1 Tax=Dispira parvispora TaxID=1520584 RepID=A0A9W8E439_9FUNG|nr:hypothetical protein IWQ62_002187 [Dispira parvispora]